MTSTPHTPLLIIGAGSGGYAAAFRAADLGLQVTLVDIEKNPGGVCLYRGCIPTKALLHVSKIITQAQDAASIGISFNDLHADPARINRFKDDVVAKLTAGLGQLSKLRKIHYIQGRARFLDSNSVSVTTPDGQDSQITYDHAVLATGSTPIQLPFASWSDRVIPSALALNVETIPQSLLIIGGGYIGLEFASFYSALGTKVTIIEMMPDILPGADSDIVAILKKRFVARMAAVHVQCKVTAVEEKQDLCTVSFEDKDGRKTQAEFEKVLVAVGRKPLTHDLALDKTKIELDDDGCVKVNPQRQTSDPAIYAIGDLTGQPMLAHKAAHEGLVAAQNIAGQKTAFHPAAIPAVVFTDPEIAWCGLTETEAKEKDIPIKVLKFPWTASGRAVTLNRSDGLTKILVEPKSGKLLGMTIVGEFAGEMIGEGVLAMNKAATAEDIMQTIHPHPTLSETIPEAAAGFHNQSLHIYRPPT